MPEWSPKCGGPTVKCPPVPGEDPSSFGASGGWGSLTVAVPPEWVEAIARRAASIVEERSSAVRESPYLSVAEAAAYLRAKPQRVYDLLSAGRLNRYKDGSRV